MAKKPVHVYPVPGVTLPPTEFERLGRPIRAVEQDVTAEEWEALQEYVPPPFTTEKPPDPPEPDQPADTQPEIPATEAGVTDSEDE